MIQDTNSKTGRTNYDSLVVEQLRESARVKEALCDHPEQIVEVAEIWFKCLQNGNKILFCGNGGSAADSQHIAAELVGRFEREREGFPALALTVDTSILTAVSNDYGFEKLFARQVSAYGVAGDILIGLTTSGESKNVLEAFREARKLNITTVAFLGRDGSAGEMADYSVRVPSVETPRIQEAHIAIGHIICGLIDEMHLSH